METNIVVATIVNAQGIKGEVRLVPWVDNPKWLLKLKTVTIFKDGHSKDMEVEKSRLHSQFVIIKFKGIDDRNEALKLKEWQVQVMPEDLPKLEEGTYYIYQLRGLQVFTEDNEYLGKIKDVLLTGANDVYVIKRESEKDLLIPVIDDVVKDINLEKGTVTVHLLDGLLDL